MFARRLTLTILHTLEVRKDTIFILERTNAEWHKLYFFLNPFSKLNFKKYHHIAGGRYRIHQRKLQKHHEGIESYDG